MHNPHIEVTVREAHSHEESLFIPKDMDASIYNGKDLKFINHYEFSIKVEVYLTDSQCLVLIRRA